MEETENYRGICNCYPEIRDLDERILPAEREDADRRFTARPEGGVVVLSDDLLDREIFRGRRSG